MPGGPRPYLRAGEVQTRTPLHVPLFSFLNVLFSGGERRGLPAGASHPTRLRPFASRRAQCAPAAPTWRRMPRRGPRKRPPKAEGSIRTRGKSWLEQPWSGQGRPVSMLHPGLVFLSASLAVLSTFFLLFCSEFQRPLCEHIFEMLYAAPSSESCGVTQVNTRRKSTLRDAQC